jgi:hypothetical protein
LTTNCAAAKRRAARITSRAPLATACRTGAGTHIFAGDHAAKIIQNALGIESDDVANYCFPKAWPNDREQRARIIGEWLQTEARFLA